MPFTLRRTPATTRYYTEALSELNDAIPLQMVLIPGGTFTMGSPEDESKRFDTEGPQHSVTLPQFFMGRYPITQTQWRLVAAMPQVKQALEAAPSGFKGDDRPVEQVSWFEAMEFCDRLSAHTKRPYRLPTESEWEYACRAGTKTPFHFGKTLTTEVSNYRGAKTYVDGPEGESRQETTPVNQFDIANAYGLCDMHGNVLEWCQDHWHDDNYDGAPTDGRAWLTDSEEAGRILRGGSWIDSPRHCRSSRRLTDTPELRSSHIGFRVVSAPPRPLQ